ncbi:MAG: MerR family transcriptional regulator [Arenimonas sp.]
MQIGHLAKLAGVAIDTVRYYERKGLLPEPLRQHSGYRRYQEEDVLRLRFIRRSKMLGFTLEEIGGLLELSGRRNQDMADFKQAAQARLQSLEARIAELERVRAGLQRLVTSCPGHGSLATCPILSALSEE